MPRLTPQPYEKLICVFKKAGFLITGQGASHIKMSKTDLLRPLIIPQYPDVGKDIISGLLRTAKMSRDEYFRLLADC